MRNLLKVDELPSPLKDNVVYLDASKGGVFIKPKPRIKISTDGEKTDTSCIGISVEPNSSVLGNIVVTHNIGSKAHIANNNLCFDQHYEGPVTITAKADNASASTTINVVCSEIATAYTYSVSNVSSPTVAWNATSATINYTAVTIASYECGKTTTAQEKKFETVTFDPIPLENLVNYPIEDLVVNTEYVDFGLPSGLKWAKYNLGAQSETEDGAYFAWAETEPYAKANDKGNGSSATTSGVFDWVIDDDNSVEVNWTVKQNAPRLGFQYYNTKYQTQNTTDHTQTKWTKYVGSTTSTYKDETATDEDALKTILDPSDDAATVHMGEGWRMPTRLEFQELKNNTYWQWVDAADGQLAGYYVYQVKDAAHKGKMNDEEISPLYNPSEDVHIFISASGYCYGASIYDRGTYGYCWSSSLYVSLPYRAYYLYFNSESVTPQSNFYRCIGRPVRGVLVSE